MYIDKKGRFHCVSHRFPINATDSNGGHAFSMDGRDPWYCANGNGGHGYCTPASPPAYNTTIVYQEGVERFGTRERPHVMFNDVGDPVALTTSVQHCQDPQVPDLCVEGDPQSCNASQSLCTNNWPGYHDRSFTSIVPLRTEKALGQDGCGAFYRGAAWCQLHRPRLPSRCAKVLATARRGLRALRQRRALARARASLLQVLCVLVCIMSVCADAHAHI
jgi:hypothetical protein